MSTFPYRELGGFRVLRELGVGPTGTCLLAEKGSSPRRFVLKLLPLSGGARKADWEQFLQSLRGSGIDEVAGHCRLHGIVEDKGFVFLVRDFVEGTTLAALFSSLGRPGSRPLRDPQLHWILFGGSRPGTARKPSGASPTAPRDRSAVHGIARLGFQAAMALENSHRRGVLHGNLKPSNVIVDRGRRVILLDPHEVARPDPTRFAEGPWGPERLRYLAPEALRSRHYDGRSDLYALGVMLYELLAAAGGGSVAGKAGGVPRPTMPLRRRNPRVPAELDAIVWKATQPSPRKRYQRGAELADDLRRFLLFEGVQAPVPRVRQRRGALDAAGRGRPPAIAAAVLLVLGGGFGAIVALAPWVDDTTPHPQIATAASPASVVPLHRIHLGMIDTWVELARRSFDREKYTRAREIYQLVLGVRPHDPFLEAELSELEARAKEEKARLLQEAPARRSLEDWDGYLQRLEEAARLDPSDLQLAERIERARKEASEDPLVRRLRSKVPNRQLQGLRQLAEGIRSGRLDAASRAGLLVQGLRHPDPFFRGETARLLGDVDLDTGAGGLRSLLEDKDWFVFLCAAKALGLRGETQAWEPLLEELDAVRETDRLLRQAGPQAAFGAGRRFTRPAGGRSGPELSRAMRELGPNGTTVVLEALLSVSGGEHAEFWTQLLEAYVAGHRDLLGGSRVLVPVASRVASRGDPADARLLGEVYLAVKNEAVREEVVTYLATHAPSARLDVLRDALLPSSPRVLREIALDALKGVSKAVALSPVLNVLVRETNTSLRIKAARIARDWDDPAVTGSFLRILPDSRNAAPLRAIVAEGLAGREGEEVADVLADTLRDDADPSVRVACARALAVTRADRALEALEVASAQEVDTVVRVAAIEGMAMFPQPEVLTRLLRLVEPGEPEVVRVAVARALARQSDRGAREGLASLLNAREVSVRLAALEGLRTRGLGSATERVSRIGKASPSAAVRMLAAVALAGAPAGPADERILSMLLEEKDPDVRRVLLAAAVARGEHGSRIAFLDATADLARGDDSYPLLRMDAEARSLFVQAFERAGGDGALRALERIILQDPSPRIRGEAAGVLGRLGGGAEVLHKVAREDDSQGVRLAALTSLASGAQSDDCRDALEALAHDPDPFARVAAADALAAVDLEDAGDALLAAAEGDASALVRRQAIEALSRTSVAGRQRRSAVLRAAVEADPDPWVREAAARALGKLPGRDVEETLLGSLLEEEDDLTRSSAVGSLRALLGTGGVWAEPGNRGGVLDAVTSDALLRDLELMPPSADTAIERGRRVAALREMLLRRGPGEGDGA